MVNLVIIQVAFNSEHLFTHRARLVSRFGTDERGYLSSDLPSSVAVVTLTSRWYYIKFYPGPYSSSGHLNTLPFKLIVTNPGLSLIKYGMSFHVKFCPGGIWQLIITFCAVFFLSSLYGCGNYGASSCLS